MKRIVVLGGTGFVGRSVCERLQRRWPSAAIVVPTRRLKHGRRLQWLPTIELVKADVHDDAALRRLLAGADAVVHLVAILHGSQADFDRVHVQLPKRLVAACAHAGVRRVVHISALGVGTDAPSRYLRSKAEGERVLREAPLDVTVLRPSVIFGREDKLLNMFATMQAVLPVMPLAGAGARFQPVWVEDVAEAVVVALRDRQTIGQVYECAGPGVCTLADLVRLAGRLAGHERPVVALPDGVARLQAAAMSLLPGEPLLSSDNLDSLKVDTVATGTLPGLADLGITPAALEAVAPGYLAPGQGAGRLNPWRAHARR